MKKKAAASNCAWNRIKHLLVSVSYHFNISHSNDRWDSSPKYIHICFAHPKLIADIAIWRSVSLTLYSGRLKTSEAQRGLKYLAQCDGVNQESLSWLRGGCFLAIFFRSLFDRSSWLLIMARWFKRHIFTGNNLSASLLQQLIKSLLLQRDTSGLGQSLFCFDTIELLFLTRLILPKIEWQENPL